MPYTQPLQDMTYALTAKKRTEVGSRACETLREDGFMPAVVYGGGSENTLVTLTEKEFEKVWREAGETTLVELSGLGKPVSVLIHDVSVDPLYGTPMHADLLQVRADETITVTVPLSFVGVAPAEKNLGGTLIKVLHEVEVEVLPKDIPHELEVDISSLETFENKVLVSDIKLPLGVRMLDDAEEVVVLVQEAREEEETSAVVDVSAVEVAKKGKAEEEGGATK